MSTQENCSVFSLSRCGQYAPAALLLVVGGAISVAVFLAAYSWERRSIRREFDSLAMDRFHAVSGVVDDSVRLLQFADNAFLVGPQADSPEFPNYVRSLEAVFSADISHYPAVRAVTWMPRVPRKERAAYQRAARAVFDPTFQFGEPSDSTNAGSVQRRGEYFPRYLRITAKPRHDQPGNSVAPDPAEWKVMERARDAGATLASEPMRTSADPDDRCSYHLFQPLYRGDSKDVASRRQALAGFLCVDLDIGQSVAKAFRDLPPVGIEVRVSDDTDGKETAVCRHASRLKSPAATSAGYDELESTWKTKFYGRELLLRCCSTPVFWADHTIWQPWVLLCGGLALTLTGVGYQLSLAFHAIAVERTVAARMAVLCQNVEARQRTK
jgi:hypothetical protein